MITVVGLGQNKNDITLNARRAIKNAPCLIARTLLSQPSRWLKKINGIKSMDDLFETAESFDELNELIVKRLLSLEKEFERVVYCVDGDGYSDGALIKLYKRNEQIEHIKGVSTNGESGFFDGVLSISASALLEKKPLLDSSTALSVGAIDNALLASDAKLYLLGFYSPQAEAVITQNGKQRKISLEDLDRQKGYNSLCSVFLPQEEGFFKDRYTLSDLMRIMHRLTAKDGCEWDKAQTHKSIRVNLIEEAYEAVDALDSGNLDAIIEELGDVMLQTIFHSDIARRGGEFDFFDVTDTLARKLVTRHTHIFGESKANNASEALRSWERAKEAEKNQTSLAQKLDAVPNVFVATLKAQKLLKRAEKAGLRLDKGELLKNILSCVKGLETETNTDCVERDIRKLLFFMTAYSAAENIDSEILLNEACSMFCKNIKGIEESELKNKKLSELL